jgi:hypothetical protein
MLRDYVYTLNPSLIEQTLSRFNILIPKEEHKQALIEFQVLTPDSFIWRFLIDGVVYYLYAEDFVQDLEYVRNQINSYAVKNAELEFVKAKQQKQFDDAEPVKSSAVYEKPEDYDEMKLYAVDSGYDFVFLCKSSEDANNALFND